MPGRGHNRSLSHSSLNAPQDYQDNMGRRPSMPQAFVPPDLYRHPSQVEYRHGSSLSRHSMSMGEGAQPMPIDHDVPVSQPTEIPGSHRPLMTQKLGGSICS